MHRPSMPHKAFHAPVRNNDWTRRRKLTANPIAGVSNMPPKKKAANSKKRKNPADEDDKEAELAELRRQLEVANREKAQLEVEKARLEHGDRDEESAGPSSRRARKLVRWNGTSELFFFLSFFLSLSVLFGRSFVAGKYECGRIMDHAWMDAVIYLHFEHIAVRQC